MDLHGCFTALITPFSGGEVDYETLARLVEEQVDSGIDGIVPVGTTGESPTLTVGEHTEVIATVIRVANGRCKVIAGTGANSTAEAVELTRHARDAGADATLQVTPYYNKPNQEGLYQHFLKVGLEGGLPVVLYQVPGRTGRSIEVDTIERLSKHAEIVAVKEACEDIDRVSEILGRGCDVTVLSGDDSLTLPRMAVGGKGVISVASNLVPREVCKLVHAALDGDWPTAQSMHKQLYPLFRDLFIDTNPIPIKAAMAMVGKINEEYRLPLCALDDGKREALKASMRAAGVDVTS